MCLWYVHLHFSQNEGTVFIPRFIYTKYFCTYLLKHVNCVLTYVTHYDVLTLVYCLEAARNNDQANWVHFGFGIWEPDDPDQTNQGAVLILFLAVKDTL